MVSAIDLTCAEATGCGSLASALSIAVVISAMVSGAKDACGKSFMRPNPVNSRRGRCAISPLGRTNAEEGAWHPGPAVTKSARRALCRWLPGERCRPDRYRCKLDRSWGYLRAVTSRASRIFLDPSFDRKQDVAMSGQTWLEQLSTVSLICGAAASLASTLGARTGKAITRPPSSTTAARAEKELNMWGC